MEIKYVRALHGGYKRYNYISAFVIIEIETFTDWVEIAAWKIK